MTQGQLLLIILLGIPYFLFARAAYISYQKNKEEGIGFWQTRRNSREDHWHWGFVIIHGILLAFGYIIWIVVSWEKPLINML